MSNPVTILIKGRGRNIIPIIRGDEIIQIHGKNGIGKSMAATMLEIAAGNYVFPDERQFTNLKNVIESCHIQIKVQDNEQIDVRLEPHVWKYEQNMNKINPDSLGSYYYNGRDIRFEDFKRKVNIRVIRGNESLTQQVKFFRDIFTSKIKQKLEKIEDSIHILKNYKNKLEQDLNEEFLREYFKKKDDFSASLDKKNNIITGIDNRKVLLESRKKQKPILEDLLIRLQFNEDDLQDERRRLEDELSALRIEQEKKIKEKFELEKRLKELEEKENKELKELLDKRENLNKKIKKAEKELEAHFDRLTIESLSDDETRQINIKNIENQIGTLEARLADLKKKFNDLNLKYQNVTGINGFLQHLEDYCNQIRDEPFASEKFIQIAMPDNSYQISPLELLNFLNKSQQEFSENEQLQQYESDVSKTNKKIQDLKAQKDVLEKLFNLKKRLDIIDKKIGIAGKDITDVYDKSMKDNIEKRLQELDKDLAELVDLINEKTQKTKKAEEKLKKLETIPSINALKLKLKELGSSFKVTDSESCKKRIEEIDEEIGEMQRALEKSNVQLKELNEKINDDKKELEKLKEIIAAVKDKKYSDIKFGEFLKFYRNHLRKINGFISKLKQLKKVLKSVFDDLEVIVSGGQPKSDMNRILIENEFDRIFKEMYNHPEFFKFVFTEYSGIKRFDIKKGMIIFKTKTGLEESRSLKDFSSGEKTYAYCRAIISMMANTAEYCIIILDESYALLDHEHSQDLYQFQKDQIREGGIVKFINILPLKENLEDVIAKLKSDIENAIQLGNIEDKELYQNKLNEYELYLQEVKEFGYYQKKIPVN
ncbi:MAG: hypothetical protein ACTSXP_13285 [Promethearchaeota archaeon]